MHSLHVKVQLDFVVEALVALRTAEVVVHHVAGQVSLKGHALAELASALRANQAVRSKKEGRILRRVAVSEKP